MDDRLQHAARATEHSRAFRVLARGGYVASGLVHALIGALAISVVVRSGAAEADQVGALSAIAGIPLGFAALWVVAALLFALGVFHVVHGFALDLSSRRKRWGRRLAEWGQGIAFCVMGGISVAVALGARPDPDETAQQASRGLLTFPGGSVLLVIVGIAVAIVGGAWVWMGIARSFRKQMTLPHSAAGHAIAGLGAVGFVGKGAALLTVGGVLALAGLERDSTSAGALDAAITSLSKLPGGNVAIVLIGVSFLAYGLFCQFRARFADL
ncbi:DUF1206 domain-containing protein [Leucobacter musarum]|uniref:DUF1206 domain-containing protein n=1 Tax=Leucobacter musarum TaxID=1930747 RepID=UPI0006A7B7A5|nr:DUF1206 domain-containing protein [Leucobacter musarum]